MQNKSLLTHCDIFCQVHATEPHKSETNIGSDNGLVPSDNKAIIWANVDPDLCRHMASLGHNELRRNARDVWNAKILYKYTRPIMSHLMLVLDI